MLISVLWEIVVYSESEVRCSAAPLFMVSSWLRRQVFQEADVNIIFLEEHG